MIEYFITYYNRKEAIEKKPQGHYRKERIDDILFYCKNCNHIWSLVAANVYCSGWRKYAEGNIPTYGKKRKVCPCCEMAGVL